MERKFYQPETPPDAIVAHTMPGRAIRRGRVFPGVFRTFLGGTSAERALLCLTANGIPPPQTHRLCFSKTNLLLSVTTRQSQEGFKKSFVSGTSPAKPPFQKIKVNWGLGPRNMPHQEDQEFSGPAEVHDFDGLLFDMDGTIIDSTDAIVKHWHQIGREIGISGDEILRTSHGRRSIDVLALLAPDRANWEYVCKAEGVIPLHYGQDAVEIPGSRRLLEQVDAADVPWAIVTSGTKPLVAGWLDVMKLAIPKVMVTAEEVAQGKPDPECYRLGAERLGLGRDGTRILVLEDAPAGIRAGKAAGYKVLGLATTHDTAILRDAGADWIVQDLRSVRVQRVDGKTGCVSIEIQRTLVV